MAIQVLLHLTGEDPVVGEVDEIPQPGDNYVTVHNPRRKDGKDLEYLDAHVMTVLWASWRVNFLEVMPETEEELTTFVRESSSSLERGK